MILSLLFLITAARSAPLGYTTRTEPYSAYSSTVFGGLTTLGMGGANFAVPTTGDTVFLNPASLAMTFSGTRVTFNGLNLQNSQLDANAPSNWNFATSFASQTYPYGFGISIRPVHQELEQFQIAGQNVTLENSTREINFSYGKVFWNDKLSLGASFVLGHGIRSTSPTNNHIVFAPGLEFGAVYQLPSRYFISAAINTAMNYSPNLSQSSTSVTDFFQGAYSPLRSNIGFGWLPSRLFHAGAALEIIGTTPNASLLANQSVLIGNQTTVVPRVGVTYSIAEYWGFKARISVGSYLEAARIQGQSTRAHITTSIQLNPWIFYVGTGGDWASGFSNIIYATGIDTMKVLEILELAPAMGPKYEAKFLHPPFVDDERGLPRAVLTHGGEEWQRVTSNTDQPKSIIEVGRELPGRIKDKFEKAPKDLMNLGPSIINNVKQVVKDTEEAVSDEDEEDKRTATTTQSPKSTKKLKKKKTVKKKKRSKSN